MKADALCTEHTTKAAIFRQAALLIEKKRCHWSCSAISAAACPGDDYEDDAYRRGVACREWYRELFGFSGAIVADPSHPQRPWDGFTRAVQYEQTEIDARDFRVMLLCMAAAVAENP